MRPSGRRGRGAAAPLLSLPSAMSVTAWLQAPSGALVITGSEPAVSSVSTVRS